MFGGVCVFDHVFNFGPQSAMDPCCPIADAQALPILLSFSFSQGVRAPMSTLPDMERKKFLVPGTMLCYEPLATEAVDPIELPGT